MAYLKIGSFVKSDDGTYEVKKDWYQQGWVFKDEEAYLQHPDEPCYVPEMTEYSDKEVYTANDILAICNGQRKFANALFDSLDWQSPESLKDEWEVENEWNWCKPEDKYHSYNHCLNCKHFPQERCELLV
jgi:hypothetical protein